MEQREEVAQEEVAPGTAGTPHSSEVEQPG